MIDIDNWLEEAYEDRFYADDDAAAWEEQQVFMDQDFDEEF